jgi:hypothetical protein
MLPIRKPYQIRSPETWDLIRSAYLRGEGAPHLARVFGVTETNIRKRARLEGWSKRAYAALLAAGGGAGRELSPQPCADPERPGEDWTSLKDAPPPSMRRWPHPLPGMGPMRAPAWEPPPGYGPMPPHLVPPVQRPEPAPAPPVAEDEGDAPTPAEAADQAVAAAARALAAGRYQEAERLGRLAAMMQKLAGTAPAGGAKAKGAAPFRCLEDEEADETVEEDKPLGQRTFTCTGATCRLETEKEQAYAAIFKLRGERLKFDDCSDVLAWADMMDGLGAKIEDEDVRRLADILRAKGPGQAHREIDAVVGRPPRPTAIYNPLTPRPAAWPSPDP